MHPVAAIANLLIVALWAIWVIVWTVAAFFVKRTRRKEVLGAMLQERVAVVAGAVVLIRPAWLPRILRQHFWIERPGLALVALALVICGMLFAYWARVHLGRNWSGQVIVKVDHALITSGPYRWVRHPIYAGMLTALAGTALATSAPYGFIGLALILFGFLVRVRLEEALMRETFPAEYDRYSQHTARLIPGVF
jgi:protein-S-isoprenylcysteine O-methyltransferase Ste14